MCSQVEASINTSSHSVVAKGTIKNLVEVENPINFSFNFPQSDSNIYLVQTKTISSPSPQPIYSSKGSSSYDSTYFKNYSVLQIIQIEVEYWHSNPQDVAKQILSLAVNFIQ